MQSRMRARRLAIALTGAQSAIASISQVIKRCQTQSNGDVRRLGEVSGRLGMGPMKGRKKRDTVRFAPL